MSSITRPRAPLAWKTIGMEATYVYTASFSLVALVLLLYQCSVQSTLILRPALRHHLVYANVLPRFAKMPSVCPLLCMMYCLYVGMHTVYIFASPASPQASSRKLSLAALMNLLPLTLAMPLDAWSRIANIARKDAAYVHTLVASVIILLSIAHVIVVLDGEKIDLSLTKHRTGTMVTDSSNN